MLKDVAQERTGHQKERSVLRRLGLSPRPFSSEGREMRIESGVSIHLNQKDGFQDSRT